MSTDITHVKRIEHLERMTSSKYGNPRYRVFFTDGTSAPTEPDSSIAYGAENAEYRDTDLEVHYNGRGNITYWKLA